MNKKIITAGILLAIGATLIIVAPTLAQPYWDEETAQYYPWWDENKTYPMPRYGLNETDACPRWNGTDQMPYLDEDGEFCPGPYWADPNAENPYNPEDAPRRGNGGCGGMRGSGGRGRGSRRGSSRWTG